MTIHRANLKALRTSIKDRHKVISNAVKILEERIKEGKANPSSAAGKHLKSNRDNLVRATAILISFEVSIKSLEKPCCQNDLNCEIESL